MLNKSIFIGRITTDPELKTTNGGDYCCNFQIAVQRTKSDTADYPELVCYKKIAENICKYTRKGDLIAVSAHYHSDIVKGKKYHNFVIDELYFISNKRVTEDENYDDIEIPECE